MDEDLFDRTRHTELVAEPWCESRAREAIERIAAQARANFDPQRWWPAHPLDRDDVSGGAPEASLYCGGAGVVWALDALQRAGAIAPGPVHADALPAMAQANRALLGSAGWRTLLGDGWQTRSWLLGDAGIQFAQWKATGSRAVLDSLERVIAANTDDPSRELMWGAAGTMLAALGLHAATGEPRWAALFVAGADALEASLVVSAQTGTALWEQSLYGRATRYLGVVHGFAGNVFALMAGRHLLAADRWQRLAERLARTVHATACRSDAGVNWPALAEGERRPPMLLQQCHGAPGMITGLAGLDPSTDELLVRAGELVWRAGPLAKGAGLCHGTAGNGYAFLRLFELTGGALWLGRARAFAMHAVRQGEADARAYGQLRYSLWTGDLGLACYLWDCIEGSCRFPTLDMRG